VSPARKRFAVASGLPPSADEAVPAPVEAAAVSPSSLPVPYTSAATGQLDAREQADLEVCEAAVDNLRAAFAAAGQALQVIRDARLYRERYGTFESYLAKRWDMSLSQAYRLIAAWPLAAQLSPIGERVTESQVRELLPVAGHHGLDAAVTVYRAIAEAEGVQVTAAHIKGAVGVLPGGPFDHGEAVKRIRAYLAGEVSAPRPDAARPVAWRPQGELGEWARGEAERTGKKLGDLLTEALEEYRARHSG
jgi:hypothetical protein